MAKPWSQVESSAEFQALSPQDKTIAKKQYWQQVVQNKTEYKKLPVEDKQQAEVEFFGGRLTENVPEDEFTPNNVALETAKGTAGVLGSSLSNLASPVLHPVQTVKALGTAVRHPIQTGKVIARSYKDRYGGVDNIADTVATDPFGFVADVVGAGAIAGQGIRQAGRMAGNPGLVAAGSMPMTRAVTGKVAQGAKTAGRKLLKSSQKLSDEATAIYRDILRPTQGEVKKIEIVKGQDIDKYYRLAAKEGLPIGKEGNQLRTLEAIDALRPKIDDIHTKLNAVLQSDTTKRFDLMDLADEVKRGLRETTKNADELAKAERTVNRSIAAEIKRHGDMVDAKTLNEIKQGMWSVGYDQLRPTSQKVARRIGRTAKNTIEKAFPDENIRALNELSGDYNTLISLLENANGRVIKGGRLGGYAARSIGALAGLNIPIVGPIGGAVAANKAANMLYDPVRRASQASRKMQKAIKRMPDTGTPIRRVTSP